MEILQDINLKKMRAKKCLTKKELARISGISRQYISLLENNPQKNITLNILEILSNSLNVCCKDLSLCDCNCNKKCESKEISLRINIRTIRLDKCLTQKELSSMSNVSREYISLLENETRQHPTIKIIEKLSESLDISPKDLIIFKCKCYKYCKKLK